MLNTYQTYTLLVIIGLEVYVEVHDRYMSENHVPHANLPFTKALAIVEVYDW